MGSSGSITPSQRSGVDDSAIGLATNVTLDPQDPNYRWIDQGLVWETLESDNYNAIDPNAVEGPDGQCISPLARTGRG